MTKNLGLVKAIFRQSSSPSRVDVLWYDTINNLLKYYDTTLLSWESLADKKQRQVSGPVSVQGAPSVAEVDSAISMSAVTAGAGYTFTLLGSGDMYHIESDGTDWHYVMATKVV